MEVGETMKPFYKCLAVSAALGVIVPVTLLTIQHLTAFTQLGSDIGYALNRTMRVTWPSSFWLMATEGIEGTPRAYVFILMSIVANVLLYSIVGSLLYGLKRVVISVRHFTE
jgi:hypothetical protein